QMTPRDELRLDGIRACFRQSPRFLWVDLTGGEPWLRKDFVDICEALLTSCRHLVLLHYPTNGYLTDKIVAGTKEIRRMGGAKLIVTISTDGDEAMHDEIRGVAGGWRGQIATFRRVRQYVETGETPMRCHALRASCFIDSWGNVFPCTIYDRKIGSLREVDYDLARIWNTPEAARLQGEIWESQCPNCWTPCEAYQSILGNLVRPSGANGLHGRNVPATEREAGFRPLASGHRYVQK